MLDTQAKAFVPVQVDAGKYSAVIPCGDLMVEKDDARTNAFTLLYVE